MPKSLDLLSDQKIAKYQISFYRWLDRILKRKRILVLGDSHASVFKSRAFDSLIGRQRFYVCSVGGATVSGLTNPNSKTQAAPIFKTWFERIGPDHIIFLIGEVDTGFVLWLRHEKTGQGIQQLVEKAISNYQELIVSMSNNSRRITVLSTPLPTIVDGQNLGDVANARKEVKASQKERTNLTLMFNSRMEAWAAQHDINYLNLDNLSLAENGLVSPHLLNSDPRDHHYSKVTYSTLIINHLKRLI